MNSFSIATLGARTFPAVAALTAADVAFAAVNDMAALAAHPQLRRITVETPVGPVRYPAPAARFAGADRRYGPVPGLPQTSEKSGRING